MFSSYDRMLTFSGRHGVAEWLEIITQEQMYRFLYRDVYMMALTTNQSINKGLGVE